MLRYILKYIRNKYKHCLTDKNILNILTNDLKKGLDDKFHFEVGIHMKVVRKAIVTHPTWSLIREITDSAYRRDHSHNMDIIAFSKDLKAVCIQMIADTFKAMMPNLERLKTKCRSYPKMQDLACALPDNASQPTAFINRNNRFNNARRALPVVAANAVPLTLSTILNWPYVILSLNLPGLRCVRTNMRDVGYNLVNLKRLASKVIPPPIDVNQASFIKNVNNSAGVDKRLVSACLRRQKQYIEGNMNLNRKQLEDLQTIFSEFDYNVEKLPSFIHGDYKMFLSRYRYFRYLFNEVPEELVAAEFKGNFDIRMEETYPPTQHITFTHVLVQEMNKNYVFKENMPWLYIHCWPCKKRFGIWNLSLDQLFKHFSEAHYDESVEWTCDNCNQTFPAKYLMGNRWSHRCQE